MSEEERWEVLEGLLGQVLLPPQTALSCAPENGSKECSTLSCHLSHSEAPLSHERSTPEPSMGERGSEEERWGVLEGLLGQPPPYLVGKEFQFKTFWQ